MNQLETFLGHQVFLKCQIQPKQPKYPLKFGRFDRWQISSWNVLRDCRKLPKKFGTFNHLGQGVTDDFIRAPKKKFWTNPTYRVQFQIFFKKLSPQGGHNWHMLTLQMFSNMPVTNKKYQLHRNKGKIGSFLLFFTSDISGTVL